MAVENSVRFQQQKISENRMEFYYIFPLQKYNRKLT